MIVTTMTTVSHRYYEKRNRRVAELNIIQMFRLLGRSAPEGLQSMPKWELVNTAMRLHGDMPR